MKIGIGVTTYNRPKHLEFWAKQIAHNTTAINIVYDENLPYPHRIVPDNSNYEFYIAYDEPRKGIAYRKNECLRALKDCDYIFLFDDDCFPIKEGWAEFFIEASKASGQQHFMYLKETPTIKKIDSSYCYTDETNNLIKALPNTDIRVELRELINTYNNSAGCMMFFTKECIEKVGAYNPKYGIYGFEHSGYSERIHKAGLTPLGAFTCPAGAGEYIYSLDLDNHLPFNKELKHEPSMAKEIQNIPVYIQRNKDIYLQDTEIYIPL